MSKNKNSLPNHLSLKEDNSCSEDTPKVEKTKKNKSKNNQDGTVEVKEKKKKKMAKWEQEGKPKPPLNAFMLFLKDTKSSIMEAKPELTPSEVSLYASGLWNELPEEEKERYKNEYRINRAKYDQQLKEKEREKEKEKEKEKNNLKQQEKQKPSEVKKKNGKDILDI